jgi:hypothetical protein
MWQTVGWICTLVATTCNAVPDVALIQTAYEREEATGSPRHDKGLQVLQSKCHDDGAGKFLCEVTFTSRGDPDERLYFDIVAVVRDGDHWMLKSGLCKR